jgi:hypothetical protein
MIDWNGGGGGYGMGGLLYRRLFASIFFIWYMNKTDNISLGEDSSRVYLGKQTPWESRRDGHQILSTTEGYEYSILPAR